MPTARGFIKYYGNRLVGTFTVDGGPRHLTIDIKTRNQTVECSNLTLTFASPEKLVGDCKWSGTVGKDDLQMDLGGGGVFIAGRLDTARPSSVPIRGTATWSAGAAIPLDQPSRVSARAVAPAPSPLNVPKDPKTLEREARLLLSGAPIVAIFGQSGAGKSTFINLITSETQAVGRGLQSCTSDINIIKAEVGGKNVVIIDTPGIDDTRTGIKEADVLVSIARRLEDMGEAKVWVTGVLFLHRISDNKFSQTANRVSNMLQSLCGEAAMSHLMLCTTMWDKVDEEEGYDRLDEISETGAWKEMISTGASVARFSSIDANAKAGAEKIVGDLIKTARPVELAIQDEMINQGKSVVETKAGQILDEHLREARKEAQLKIEELQKASEANAAEAREMIRVKELEVERLKKQAEEQVRQQKAEAERLRREGEDANRKMKELQRQMREAGEASAAAQQEAIRAQELQLRKLQEQREEKEREQKAEAERLKEERDEADRQREAMLKTMREQHAADLAEAAAAFEAAKATQWPGAATTRPERGFFYYLNPLNWFS